MASDPTIRNMTSNLKAQPSHYHIVLSTLLSYQHIFYSPPTSPHKLHIHQTTTSPTPTISSLSLHPVLESLLHILNCDLPSAHFLCRHAEVAPKYESMYVHGILHRIEGDIDNTRAWYGNVQDTEIFRAVWDSEEVQAGTASNGTSSSPPPIQTWPTFLDRLARYRDRTRTRRKSAPHESDKDKFKSRDSRNTEVENVTDWTHEENVLRETSLWEIQRVLRFCEAKFGLDALDVQGAKGEFLGRIESGDERLAKIAQGMITGGEGWRVF